MGADKDKIKRIFGYVFLGLSGASLFVGFSPAFPIIGPAFLMSGIFAATGIGLLAGKEIRTLAGRARAALASGKGPRVSIDPILPVKVLSLAKERSGTLTVSEVAISLKVPIEQAEAALDSCLRSGAAIQDYEVTQGYTVYRFPEFLPPEDRKELLGS
jgi:hypothetical protein